MKKLFLILAVVLISSTAMAAAGTMTATQCAGSPYSWGNNVQMYCFEILHISGSSASGDKVLSTMLETAYGAQQKDKLMRAIAGHALYWVDYLASGAANAPTTAALITIDKEGMTVAGASAATAGALIFSETVATAATSEGWPGDIDTGKLVPITDVTLAMGTLADTKRAVVRLWFYGGKN